MSKGAPALLPDARPADVSEVLAEVRRFGGLLGLDANPEGTAFRAAGAWSELGSEGEERAMLRSFVVPSLGLEPAA